MKYKLPLLSVGIVCLLFILIAGCRDKCKDIQCKNDSVCDKGTCTCLPGYEGDNCEIESRVQFFGTYDVEENCALSGSWNYTSNISGNPENIAQVRIANFFNDFAGYVYANIGEATLTIFAQDPDDNNWTVQGFGTLVADTITFTYTIRDNNNGVEDNCPDSKWVR